MLSKFKRRSLALSALMLGGLLGFPISQASASHIDENDRNEHAVLRILIPTLTHAEKAGRIYYAADCPLNLGHPYIPRPFPKIDMHRPSQDVSGLEAVREIFEGDKNVVVAENPPGVIDIVIGKPSIALLQAYIHDVPLDIDAKFDPTFTLDAIKNNVDVQSAAKKLGVRLSDTLPLGYIPVSHEPGQPAIAGPLRNLTMDDALDVVAQTFGVIILYSSCTNQNYIDLDHTGGPGFDWLGWNDRMYAIQACEATYQRKFHDFKINFVNVGTKIIPSTDGYIDVIGTATFMDKAGISKEGRLECKVPETP